MEIPECLAGLKRDRRGYPIPVTAMVDREGRPHFTITDQAKRHQMIKEDRCHLSGRKLFRGRWFIGGPMAAFHPQGAFLDGPMLDEASLFAVRTCPFIAAPKYSRRIDDLTAKNAATGPDTLVIRMHEEVTKDRPPLFARVMTIGQKLAPSSDGDVVFVPKKPYRRVEFWQNGKKLDFEEGLALAVETSNGELTERDIRTACGRK